MPRLPRARIRRARIRRFCRYAEAGYPRAYCLEVAGITDWHLGYRLWRDYLNSQAEGRFYD